MAAIPPTVTTSTVRDARLLTLIAQRALDVLRAPAVLVKTVLNDAGIRTIVGQTFDRGDVVNFYAPTTYTARDYAEDTIITFDDADTTAIPLTLNKKKYTAIAPHNVASSLEGGVSIPEYETPAMMWGLVSQVESDIAAEYSNFTGSVGTGGVDVTKGAIFDAMEVLDEAEAPADNRHLVLDPHNTVAILNDPDLVTYFSRTQIEAMRSGIIGEMAGFTVHKSPRIYNAAGTSYNLAYHQSAVGISFRPMKPTAPGPMSSVMTDPDSGVSVRAVYGHMIEAGTDAFKLDVLYGIKTIRAALGVQVLGSV